jgi:hypothetical protein
MVLPRDLAQKSKSDILDPVRKQPELQTPDYSEDELQNIGGLQSRLERAFAQRNQRC